MFCMYTSKYAYEYKSKIYKTCLYSIYFFGKTKLPTVNYLK